MIAQMIELTDAECRRMVRWGFVPADIAEYCMGCAGWI